MIESIIPFKLQIFAIFFSVILLLFIIMLIRKNQLKEGYSILWFAIALSFLIISVWTNLLELIAFLLGIEYAPAMLFAVLLLGIILISIHFSVLLSMFDKKTKTLAQYYSFVEYEIKNIKNELDEAKQKIDELSNSKKLKEK